MIGVMANSEPSAIAPATRRLLDAMIADRATPGLQYAFVSADAVLFSYHGGSADLRAHRAVTEYTTFNSYSVTKTFTAAAILRLAEQCSLELDRPIAMYLERWPQIGKATIRQALLHTGGFANPNPLRWVHLVEEEAAFDRTRFVEEVMRAHGRPIWKPGARYVYSNIGYLVLGELIEKVSGQPYVEYVQRQLLRPLRLRDGESLAFDIPRPQVHARGTLQRLGLLNLVLGFFIDRNHLVEGNVGRWVQFRSLNVNGDAYGGLIGNAQGFARYLQAVLSGEDILSPTTRAMLFTAASAPGPARSLGWFMGRLDDELWFAHAGGGAGYYCEVRVYPRVGRASVVMLNRTGVRDAHILDRLDRPFLARSHRA